MNRPQVVVQELDVASGDLGRFRGCGQGSVAGGTRTTGFADRVIETGE